MAHQHCTTVKSDMLFLMKQSYEGYSHQKPTKEEHEDEVSRASSERALLEHTTVSVPESQVKEISTERETDTSPVYDNALNDFASLLVCTGTILV